MYLLLGMGISNKSIAKYFDKHHIKYQTYDDKFNDNIILDEIDTVIKSPGIKKDHHVLQKCKELNINITCELDLFEKYKSNQQVISVTGTNGKSSTCMMLKTFLDYDVCGNIGYPLFDFIDKKTNLIIETSSFMGEIVQTFKPDISIITNLNPNHLDHHNTLNDYFKSKYNLLKNTKEFIIYSNNQNIIKDINVNKYNINDYFKVSNNNLIFNNNIYNINELDKQIHSYKDSIMISLLLAHLLNIDNAFDKLKTYKPMKYRQNIYYINNYKIINDSKSTNCYALNNCIENIFEKFILIVGGKKMNNYEIYANIDNIIIVYLYGENKYDYYKSFTNLNVKCKVVDTIDEIILDIKNNYKQGVICFSPGSVSYDMFKNYIMRGDYFNEIVGNILK